MFADLSLYGYNFGSVWIESKPVTMKHFIFFSLSIFILYALDSGGGVDDCPFDVFWQPVAE